MSQRKQQTETKAGWSLHHGTFQVFWKADKRGKLYADMVRIEGATFFYCGQRKKLKRGDTR